jgi:exopolysaccharide biosynthesis protein
LQIFVIPSGEVAIASNTSKTTTTSAANVKESNNTTYEDDNIKITIKTLRENDTNIYVADVTISNIDYLKTAFANNTYGRNIKETTSSMAENNNAILAINGDYYGFRNYGFVLRNGVVYRSTSNENEDLVINSDGSFSIVDEDNTDLESLLNNGALQVFSFGPALINNSNNQC